MSRQITITLPDKVILSMEREGEALEESAAEFAKRQFISAYTTLGGILLDLKPVEIPGGDKHPELPLA